MKRILRKALQIFLSLFLSFVIVLTGLYVINKINYSKLITQEEFIADFNENKEKFETVKDYMLTIDQDIYLNPKNYTEKVHEHNVKTSLEFIFSQLNYNEVIKYGNINFEYHREDKFQMRITYEEKTKNIYNYVDLGEHWYYSSFEYDLTPDEATEIVKNKLIFVAVVIILSIGLYFILGLIPPFKKRKFLSDI